jgi:hypothetical protein
MIRDVLVWFPAGLAWVAVGYTFPALLRRRHDPAFRAFWLSLLFLALSLSVLVPPGYAAIDKLSGVANLARLLGNALILVAGWQVQAFLFHLNYPDDRARLRIGWSASFLAAALILLTAFFALAPVRREAADFVGRYADAPFVLEYRLVFLAYLGWALGAIVFLSWRYAKLVERPALRLGLRVDALGGILGLGYVLNETLRVSLPHVFGGTDPIPRNLLVTQLFEASAVTLMLVGCTMPAWGPRVGIPTLVEWLSQYRTYRRLGLLWRVVYQASPEIALSPPRSTVWELLDPRDLSFRLHRRVIEIRDGCLALEPFLDPLVAEDARRRCASPGLASRDTEAIVAALSLAVALAAKREGGPAEERRGVIIPFGGTDLVTEAAALERVADAWARSALVRSEFVGRHARTPKRLGTSS